MIHLGIHTPTAYVRSLYIDGEQNGVTSKQTLGFNGPNSSIGRNNSIGWKMTKM